MSARHADRGPARPGPRDGAKRARQGAAPGSPRAPAVRAPRAAPLPPPADPARGARAAAALWTALALLAVMRAALAFTPGTWGWSLALNRHLAPLPGWGAWIVLALALVPAVAARIAPLAARAGDALVRAPGRAATLGALAAATLVLLLPDRVGFVGDFLLRRNTLATEGISLAHWYPQALPLDLFIHAHAAHALMGAFGVSGEVAARMIGALDAALMAALAVRFAWALGLAGAAALAAAAGVFFTGALTLFTGYDKGFAEMTLVVAATGVLGMRAARSGSALLPLGLVAAAGFTLHRSALGLLPALAIAWGFALRARGRAAWREPVTWIAAALPVATLAAMLPRIVDIMRRIDPIHFTPAEPGRGVLASAFAGARPADMLNLAVMLAPLAIAIPAAIPLGRAAWRRRECVLLLALALPFVALVPFIHAQQGLFRDWDDFAAAGVGVALLAAFLAAETLRATPRHAWLAVPVALAAIVPSAQWLAHDADLARGLARVRAFVEERPARTPFERAMTWQYLGQVNVEARHPAAAADAYAHAARLLPSPHILRQWGAAETMAGHADSARRVFRTLLDRLPHDEIALRGVAVLSMHLRDTAQARACAETLLSVSPGDPTALKVIERIASGHPFDVAPRP
jgi:hypothetical protein